MRIGACITSVSGPVLREDERAFLKDASPWGVILMGRSCQSREQVRALTGEIKAALGRDALIFIDQEGGRVARLKAPEWPWFPAAGLYAELYERDPAVAVEACRLGHRLIAGELFSLGITADCAPVADLRQPDTHDAIGDRAFGYEPEAVGQLAGAALDGLSAGGVAGCLKHMPGQGRARVDSHHSLPVVEAPLSDLDADFSVFTALAEKSPMGMTGHVSYTAIAPGEAATVSATVISDIIRGRIGFEGLLMTDDLGMNALGGTLADRGDRALSAGCDLLLHCSGFLSEPEAILSEMQQIASAAGTLSGLSLQRAIKAEGACKDVDDLDPEASWARFRELMGPVMEGMS
ncbi:MAG: beta-N-acetylhexosaminidase [Henriciella sp.]|nr:beta-N-acetylhexosaminidase [Henriciella sp.]